MKKMLRLLSRISVRLLAFNVLLVFLPITAFLTLDTYEQQLLQALEHALVQQARVLSSALSGQDPISPDSAGKLLEQLRQRHEARLRVVDSSGRLVADSSRLGPKLTVTDAVPEDLETSAEDAQSSLLYHIASFPIRLYRHIRFIESFASDVSHEFKPPLASIRSATEMALQAETPEDRGRFLAMIQQDVARMEHLLSGVREISQIDAQLGEEDRQAVDIYHLVAQVVEGFRLREPDRGVQIRLGSKPAKVRVYLALERLSQIVENLLVDALDFSPPNEAVDISVQRQGNEAILQIEDRGPGIPEQHLGRIFDRFFTFRPQPNRTGQTERHTGLGLAIIKALAEGYGGSITAVNRPGGGACFRVSLPLYRS